MKFVYKDNSKGQWKGGKWIAPVVFECEAETILQADDLYTQKTGKDVTKQVNIGCIKETDMETNLLGRLCTVADSNDTFEIVAVHSDTVLIAHTVTGGLYQRSITSISLVMNETETAHVTISAINEERKLHIIKAIREFSNASLAEIQRGITYTLPYTVYTTKSRLPVLRSKLTAIGCTLTD